MFMVGIYGITAVVFVIGILVEAFGKENRDEEAK